MPHIPVHPSAEKRHRQNLRRRTRNRLIKARVHTSVKEALDAINGSDPAAAKEALQLATKTLNKAASKGTMHRNTAARKISRLAARLSRNQKKSAS
jgi:small subunit ribosomal protein S20